MQLFTAAPLFSYGGIYFKENKMSLDSCETIAGFRFRD